MKNELIKSFEQQKVVFLLRFQKYLMIPLFEKHCFEKAFEM